MVSTAIGCKGLEVAAGEDIIIAEDSGEMAAVIVDLLQDREKARRIGRRAVETVKRKYDFAIVGQQLENLLVMEYSLDNLKRKP